MRGRYTRIFFSVILKHTNEAKRELLNVNLLCYALVRQRQHMRVYRPLKTKKLLIQITSFFS